jgi:hypothetical protein
MNMIHAMIANSCRGCIEDNNFTDTQKIELRVILDKFQAVKISNIWKFTKYLKQFEDKYAEFGGDVKMLESRIQNIRDEQYLAAAKMVPGIQIVKKGD